MRNLLVGGLAALGLVGGTAAVVYNNSGDATVKIKENGVTRTVKVGGASSGGPTYSCPEDVVEEKIDPSVKLAGRIKLTLHDVETQIDPLESQLEPLESQLDALNERYPGGTAPGPVVSEFNSLSSEYNSLSSEYNHLVDHAEELQSAYNQAIDKHNDLMAQECERE